MVKINIGGFELDSKKLPNEGLDYSKFDARTKLALSVFDTDNHKGHLSRAELQKAISFFASSDGIIENGVDDEGNSKIIIHKKDNKLDKYEKEKSQRAFESKLFLPRLISKYIEKHPDVMKNHEIDDIESTVAYVISLQKAAEKDSQYMWANMDDALEMIHISIKANEKGYKQTDIGKYVFQSNDGKFYTYYNGEFYSANKSGRFSIKQKLNEKGQQSCEVHDKDGNFVMLKALNYENKMYKKKDYAAKLLGLDKCHAGFYRQSSLEVRDLVGNMKSFEVYTWDDKNKAFKFKYYTNVVSM